MHTTARRTRVLILMLCAALVLLSACSTTTEESGGAGAGNGPGAEGTGTAATGRYLEETLPLPADLYYIMMLEQDAAGDLWLFGSRPEPDENGSPWVLYRSTDAGTSWATEQPGWLVELAEMSIQTITLALDGGFTIYYTVPEVWEDEEGEDDAPMPEADVDEEEPEGAIIMTEEDMDDFWANFVPPEGHLVDVDGDTVTERPYGIEAAYGYVGDILVTADNGDLLYSEGYELQQLDGATGVGRNVYQPNNYLSSGDFASAHGRLALLEDNSVGIYDLGTGERLGEIAFGEAEGGVSGEGLVIVTTDYMGHQAVTFDPQDPDAVYFALDSGLYRGVIDSPAVERLVDGELASLNMPALNIIGMFALEDGRFLVRASGNDSVLLRYTYDPDVPSAPSTELTVYSLEENRSVRQFMSLYQLQNPDVKVSYTVGVPQGSAVTNSDALRSLNTELLGGTGPDILVLDGLPVDSYIRQGALADLRVFYAGVSDSLLENVAGAWMQADGSVYAIPAKFTVPTLLAPASADGIENIADLVGWAEGLDRFSMFTSSGDKLLNILYPLLADSWFDEAGALDREAFADSLQMIDRLLDAMESSGGRALDMDDEKFVPNSLFDSVFYANGSLSMNVDEVTSLGELEQFYSALQMRAGTLGPMPTTQGRRVFLPGTVLAVNSATAHEDLALEFLTLALSEQGQTYDLGDGMPVHRAALLAQTESPYEEGTSGGGYMIGFSTSFDDDEDPDGEMEALMSGTLSIEWPSQEFFDNFLAALEMLEPAAQDAVVRQIALEECKAYFAGSSAMIPTVDALAQKVDLYLSERR